MLRQMTDRSLLWINGKNADIFVEKHHDLAYELVCIHGLIYKQFLNYIIENISIKHTAVPLRSE